MTQAEPTDEERHDEGLADRLRRVVEDQVEQALAEVADDDLGTDETIHQVRKRCKKVRAVLRLVRPGLDTYDASNAAFRDAARRLSDHRDAQSFLEALDDLAAHFGDLVPTSSFEPVRAGLVAHRDGLTGPDTDVEDLIDDVADELERACDALGDAVVEGDRYEVVAGGIAKSYGRARKALAEAYADPQAARFHEWRKRAKYHRYHVRLLADSWPEVLDPLRKSLHTLTDLLGDAHDLAELRKHLTAHPEEHGGDATVQLVVALADQRRAELRARARPLGLRLFHDPKRTAAERLTACFRIWEESADDPGFARLGASSTA